MNFENIYNRILEECRFSEEDCGTVCASQCSSTGLSAFAPQNVVSLSKEEKEDEDKLI